MLIVTFSAKCPSEVTIILIPSTVYRATCPLDTLNSLLSNISEISTVNLLSKLLALTVTEWFSLSLSPLSNVIKHSATIKKITLIVSINLLVNHQFY